MSRENGKQTIHRNDNNLTNQENNMADFNQTTPIPQALHSQVAQFPTAEGAVEKVLVQWIGVDEAQGYELQASASTDFETAATFETDGSSFIVPCDVPGAYVRVRSLGADGPSDWSAVETDPPSKVRSRGDLAPEIVTLMELLEELGYEGPYCHHDGSDDEPIIITFTNYAGWEAMAPIALVFDTDSALRAKRFMLRHQRGWLHLLRFIDGSAQIWELESCDRGEQALEWVRSLVDLLVIFLGEALYNEDADEAQVAAYEVGEDEIFESFPSERRLDVEAGRRELFELVRRHFDITLPGSCSIH